MTLGLEESFKQLAKANFMPKKCKNIYFKAETTTESAIEATIECSNEEATTEAATKKMTKRMHMQTAAV